MQQICVLYDVLPSVSELFLVFLVCFIPILDAEKTGVSRGTKYCLVLLLITDHDVNEALFY